MDTRREPEKNSLERIGARVRQRALTGGEASVVGFTLVVYIFAGAGLGYLADTYLETSYCIAIGTLLGAVVGFREMFRLTKKLTRNDAVANEAPRIAAELEYSRAQARAAGQNAEAEQNAAEASAEAKRPKPRIFSVPPPPQASYEQRRSTPGTTPEPVESQEELIERLSENDSLENEKDSPGEETQTK